MKKLNQLFLASLAISTPFLSSAHPGHGDTDGFSIIHYFTEPDHAIVLGAVLACVGVYYLYAKSKKQTQK
jgi:hypothetical protein